VPLPPAGTSKGASESSGTARDPEHHRSHPTRRRPNDGSGRRDPAREGWGENHYATRKVWTEGRELDLVEVVGRHAGEVEGGGRRGGEERREHERRRGPAEHRRSSHRWGGSDLRRRRSLALAVHWQSGTDGETLCCGPSF